MSDISQNTTDSEINDCITPLPPKRTSRKRPRSSIEIFQSLICGICSDYFIPPIINCSRGHSTCQICIEKSGRYLGVFRCPECRQEVDLLNRNWRLEDQLKYTSIPCKWRKLGCNQEVSLSEREKHTTACEFRPYKNAKCHFNHVQHGKICTWRGSPADLCTHLEFDHNIPMFQRHDSVKFLWNPPNKEKMRYRYRIIEVDNQTPHGPTSKYILEHLYDPDTQLSMFLVRSPHPDSCIPYEIRLNNREDEANSIAFFGRTLGLDDVNHIMDFYTVEGDQQELDRRKVFCVPLIVLNDFVFYCSDDQDYYFSLHVNFHLNKTQKCFFMYWSSCVGY